MSAAVFKPARFFRSEVYGIITSETVSQICQRRLLAASLMARAPDKRTSHAAKMVHDTVASIEAELMELLG